MRLARFDVMKRSAQLAMAAGLLIFGAANTARAELVLSYVESGAQLQFVATDDGTTTTFSSTPITVLINIPRLGISGRAAFMRFNNVHSVGMASNGSVDTGNTSGIDYQSFIGTVEFNSRADFNKLALGDINYLTAIFTNPHPNVSSNPAILIGKDDEQTSNLAASSSSTKNPAKTKDTVSYTSSTPLVVTHGTENFSLAFSGITPNTSVNGTTIQGFHADGAGTFNADVLSPPFPNSVPEPTTVVGAALAGFVALGFGLRRRRTSVA